MDLADVFFVLHLLTRQGFIVDEDVRGRVSVDLSQVGLEDVLAQLARAGLAVSPPGPLRRVSRGATAVAVPATSGEATRVTFALKRAPLADLVAVMADADPSLGALPRPAAGRLTLWAREARLSDVRAAVAQILSAGSAAGGDADPPRAPAAPPERRLLVRADELSMGEFQLAGVASAGEGWTAFAYAPTGVLNAYRRGDHLADGAVADVQSTDVLLANDEGPVRLLLPEAAR
jgi:hypothetical protein